MGGCLAKNKCDKCGAPYKSNRSCRNHTVVDYGQNIGNICLDCGININKFSVNCYHKCDAYTVYSNNKYRTVPVKEICTFT